jgi:VanZ family protein
MNKNTPRRFLSCWLPAISLCAAIFVQSCFASPDVGPMFPMKDKVLHLAAYGLLAVLVVRACRLTWPDRLSPKQLLVIGVVFATLYGVSDEFHQSFVAARSADALDGIADFIGSILGAGGYMVLIAKRTPRRRLG